MPQQASIQQRIPIKDIQDGVVILDNGNLRGILMATATNFSLKSTDEQDSMIFKYQQFLNSLDFSLQIVAVSRRLDISDYIAGLEQRKREQPNELLRIQIAEYIDFVQNLIQVSNIMDQSFFVVVPLAQVEKKEGNLLDKLGLFQKETADQQSKSLDELKTQLWQRMEYIIAGLSGVGIKAVPLNSQEITELFYHLYNMGAVENLTLPPEQQGDSGPMGQIYRR